MQRMILTLEISLSMVDGNSAKRLGTTTDVTMPSQALVSSNVGRDRTHLPIEYSNQVTNQVTHFGQVVLQIVWADCEDTHNPLVEDNLQFPGRQPRYRC